MSSIFVLVLLIIGVCLSAMVAGYGTLSTSHLRHWARQDDDAAKKLYPLKARGASALLTIEMLRAFSLSAVFVLLATLLSTWFAWLLISVLLFVAFILLTQLYLKPFGIRLLIILSGPLLMLTNALKPVMLPLGRVFDRFLDEEPITLTRQELKRMLTSVALEDTDLTTDELRILDAVLMFSKQTVHDVMIPKSKVVTVSMHEELTPVVVDDLYKSGHEFFPVMGEDKKTVVGLLNMHDLMDIKHHSAVEDTMQPKVYYVDEDRHLDHVLQVFYKTKQTVFVVHNSASDMMGLITIEDVLKEIVGKPSTKEMAKTVSLEDEQEKSSGEEQMGVVK